MRGRRMTRKERALKNLKQMCSDGRYLGSGSYVPLEVLEDFEVAIKALEQEPIIDKIRAEIKEWYWQADKQALAKDPCVVDAMIDLFIRTINKYKAESEDI